MASSKQSIVESVMRVPSSNGAMHLTGKTFKVPAGKPSIKKHFVKRTVRTTKRVKK